MLSRDPACTLPTHHDAGSDAKLSSHRPNAAESLEEVAAGYHGHRCAGNLHAYQGVSCTDLYSFFEQKAAVVPRATQLKRLREKSGISVRKFAARLGIEPSKYAYYEDANSFKKPHLPIDLARAVAGVLADYGIDQTEVMQLAGVEADQPFSLSQGEQAWLVVWRALSPGQRRLVLDQLYCSLGWKEPTGEPDLAPALAAAA